MAERNPEQIDFEDELRHYYKASPFAPFDIVTSSGERYVVTDPSQMAFGSSAVVVVLPRAGTQVIRKNQISAIHVHEAV